mgnify:CR=1 FL=1
MYNFTVTMALMDYLPVFFFGVSAVLLLRDLYNKMFKGAYALLAAGWEYQGIGWYSCYG